ncbi:MAG: hypothetical protein K1X64_21605 [Myxococcaceae bacterium]|nr:hypothetical protein [Myxococcaceae bacterium]
MSNRVRRKPVRNLQLPELEFKTDDALLRSAKRTLKQLSTKKADSWQPPQTPVPPAPPPSPAPSGTVIVPPAPDAAQAVSHPSLLVVTGAPLPAIGTDGVPRPPPAQVPVITAGRGAQTPPPTTPPAAPPSAPPHISLPGGGANISLPSTGVGVIDQLALPAYQKIKGEVEKLLASEAFKARDITLADMKVGEFSGVTVKSQFQVLSDSDPLIANDAVRSASVAAAKAAKRPETWALTGGGLFPSVEVGATIPTGQGPDITLGFSAGVGIGFSVLAPYPHDASLTLDVVKNNSIAMPFSADAATALKAGTEFNFTGTGNAAANVNTSIGKKLSSAYGGIKVTAGVWADVGVSVATNAELNFRVKRLDGSKVFVAVSQGYDVNGAVTAGISGGVDVTLPQKFPTNPLPGGVFGPMVTKALGVSAITPQKLAGEINKVLKFDVRAEAAQQKSSREIQSYVFDLSKPEARAAYEKMMHLDFREADKQVEAARAGADTGVKAAHYVEQFNANSETLKANLFTLKALNAVSKRSTLHGKLDTAQGSFEYDRADLERSYSGLITNYFRGSREVKRELVMLKRPSGVVDNYFHVRSEVDSDYVTSKSDLRQFLALSELSSGANEATTKLRNDEKMLGNFGTTNRVVDLYVTDAGIERLAKMSEVELEDAYALYLRTKTDETPPSQPKPYWTGPGPWADRGHPRHGLIMNVLNSTDGGTQDGFNLDSEYREATGGRSLNSDSNDWQDCRDFVKLVRKLQTANSPQQRAQMLVNAHKQLGFGLDMLGALTASVGPENVLVNEMSIHDKSREMPLVIHREGEVQDPRALINTLINAPQ